MGDMNDDSVTFEGRHINDLQLYERIGYAVNARYFLWLQICMLHDICEKVDDDLLIFKPIITNILNDYFYQN